MSDIKKTVDKESFPDGTLRVRFAPSPTGPLHIGGVRTALFNYLFAKKHNGSFILRIEDTDQNRYVEGAEQYIIDALNWCGIPYDEGIGKEKGYGPYRQSERKHLYKQFVDTLVASGHAYYAFDTNESLENHRKDHETKGKTFIYNHHNREKLDNSLTLSEDVLSARLQSGEPYVIRFKTPVNKTLILNDLVRGQMEIDTNVLDDKVLFKSDGMPTYHLANVVDDHLMDISHVIRGEEWLPSLALHQLLYDAFEWKAPQFAHLPLIMKPVGKGKLSKRDGDKMGFPVFPLEWKSSAGESFSGYREEGYLPEAVVNMLALLGWNPGTEQEIFSLDELIQLFDLGRVHKGGAKFDPEKTKWFQHHYFQALDIEKLTNLFIERYSEDINLDYLSVRIPDKETYYSFEGFEREKVKKVLRLIKERATFVSDLWEQGSFFFIAPNNFDIASYKKIYTGEAEVLMDRFKRFLFTVEDFSAENLSEKIKNWITSENIGFGKIMMPLRLALVGEMKGPDVFAIMEIIGKVETIKRIENAIKTLG